MINKIKGGEKLSDKEIIRKFYCDDYDLKGITYDPESFKPKKSFYDTYFSQNRRNFIVKTIVISGVTFVVGCGFGIFMLALQSFGTMGMIQTFDDKKYKYENFKEVRQAFVSVLLS